MNSKYYGELGVLATKGSDSFIQSVDNYLRKWREEDEDVKDSYIMPSDCIRFGSGEAKCLIRESCRGKDLFVFADVFNYGATYKMYGMTVPMSPDDHFQDLKRIIGAMGGKARRVSVFMPMLYEGRQDKRSARESLDCAEALQELVNLGVTNIITFDAHNSSVQNAIPGKGFDDVRTSYQMLKALSKEFPDIKFDPKELMIISPDEGGTKRAMYYASVLGVDLGMFYKRRNYTVVIDGRNPIEAHEFLGNRIDGKDVIIVDDMISSGESAIDVAKELKKRGARRVFMFATFGLFCNGCEKFDQAYNDGIITRIFTTNLNYRSEEVRSRPWYTEVNMCKYVSLLIDTLNKDESISKLLDPVEKIHTLVDKARNS